MAAKAAGFCFNPEISGQTAIWLYRVCAGEGQAGYIFLYFFYRQAGVYADLRYFLYIQGRSLTTTIKEKRLPRVWRKALKANPLG